MTDIYKCCFCGQYPKMNEKVNSGGCGIVYYIKCLNCEFTAPRSGIKEDAIKRWNSYSYNYYKKEVLL